MTPEKNTITGSEKVSLWSTTKRWIKNRRVAIVVLALIKQWKYRGCSHDAIYDTSYFDMVDRTSGESSKIMAKTIAEYLHPTNVIDVGCGPGRLILELQTFGIRVCGLEYSSIAIEKASSRSLPVQYFDATDPDHLSIDYGKFELAICLEVVQQLPPAVSRELIAFICRHADTVLFSSPPCADDRNPKCPRPKSHWVDEFRRYGFVLDQALSSRFQSTWKSARTASWFYRDPMVFRLEKS